jgi:hypothetical protein
MTVIMGTHRTAMGTHLGTRFAGLTQNMQADTGTKNPLLHGFSMSYRNCTEHSGRLRCRSFKNIAKPLHCLVSEFQNFAVGTTMGTQIESTPQKCFLPYPMRESPYRQKRESP